MKTLALLQTVLAFLITVSVAAPENTATPDPVYGEYPKNYKQIVQRWLEKQLVDPASAKIEWLGEPKPAELPDAGGKRIYGYRVDFKVNSRNRFGAPTGMQTHGAFIRDGAVIKGFGFGF